MLDSHLFLALDNAGVLNDNLQVEAVHKRSANVANLVVQRPAHKRRGEVAQDPSARASDSRVIGLQGLPGPVNVRASVPNPVDDLVGALVAFNVARKAEGAQATVSKNLLLDSGEGVVPKPEW